MRLTSFFQSKKLPYRLGIALSGGGVKGLAHAGALQAMIERGIKPDIIAGTSAGSLAGALYADGYSPEEILALFTEKGFTQFVNLSMIKGGLFKSEKFRIFLNKHLRSKNLEDLQVPLRVITTNIENGKMVVFEKGPIIPAILASCAFPIVFAPIEIEKSYYVDGGLLKNFPVSVIKRDCDYVIGVNVNPVTKEKYRDSLMYVAERTFHYVTLSNTIADRRLCDILIEPKKVSNYKMFNLEHCKTIYQIGYDATIESFEKKKNKTTWDKIELCIDK